MIKKAIIMIILVSFILMPVFAQGRETARGHITQGQEHMRTGDFGEAVASFEAALRLEPRNRQAETLLREAREKRMQQTFNHAQTLHQEGNLAEAIVQYDLAIRYAPPGHANIRMIQARRIEAYNALSTQTAAERTEQSRRALQSANENFIAWKFAEAIASYEQAVEIGGLTEAQAAEAQRLITEAQAVVVKMAVESRPVNDNDFDIVQNPTGGVTIVKYKGAESTTVNIGGENHTFYHGIMDVTIPGRIYGATVTVIGPGAFRNTGITSLVIPDSVTEIGISAFSGNRLERVNLGRGVRIIRGSVIEGRNEAAEPGAFEGNKQLTTVVIPDTTTEIGSRAFRDCGLTTVTLGRVVAIIGESAFRNNNLTVVTLPVSVRRINRYAFHGNQLQAVTIPNGVEVILDDAFTNNPMTAVVIPPSLVQLITIGGQAVPRIGGDHVLFSAHIPSFPDTLVRVTLPANVHDRNMGGFEESLRNFYISQGRAAGTYVKNGPIWAR